jgi:hypothetical protein
MNIAHPHFAVVGNPITHSRSPAIHSAFALQTGITLQYDRIEAAPEAFEACVAEMKKAVDAMVMGDPLSSTAAPTPCDGSNWFGWACDDELEAIRQEFITAGTDEELHDIASRYQAGFYEITNYIPLGEFYTPIAYRANLTGVLHRPAPMLVVWNIEFE